MGSSQELLLALFLKDPAWAKAASAKISPEDFVDPRERYVVEAIWLLMQEGESWTVSDLLGRLNDEAAQSLVTRLLSIEEGKIADSPKVFEDCIGRIVKEKQKKIRGQLMEAIRQAEAQQDMARLDQLKEEFNQLLKYS